MFNNKFFAFFLVFCVTVNAGNSCSGLSGACTVCSNLNQTTCQYNYDCSWCNNTCYYNHNNYYNLLNQWTNGTCTQHSQNCEYYSTATDACISYGGMCILIKGQCSSNPPSTSLLPSSSSTTQCNYCTPLGKADCDVANYCSWQNNSCVFEQINCSSLSYYGCIQYSGSCQDNFTQNSQTGAYTGNCLFASQVKVSGNCTQQKTNCASYSTSQDLCVLGFGGCVLATGYCSTSTSTSTSTSSLSKCSYCGPMNQTSCNNAKYCQWTGSACSLLPDYNQDCSQLFDSKCDYASYNLNLCQYHYYYGSYQCQTPNMTNGTLCTQNVYNCEYYSTSTDLCTKYMGQCILVKDYCPSVTSSAQSSSVTQNKNSSPLINILLVSITLMLMTMQ